MGVRSGGPPDKRNGPQVTPPESRSQDSVPTSTTNAPTVARGTDNRSIPEQTALPLRHPAAYVSLFAPSGRRRMWWFTYLCPACSYGHFGRVRDEDSVEGLRRAGCGRIVWLVVARTYRGQNSEVAA